MFFCGFLTTWSTSGQRKKGACDHIMVVFDMHQKFAGFREKGTGPNSCVLGQEGCPACALLTLNKCSSPTCKNRKDKKKDKDKGQKLVDPTNFTVIGPMVSEAMDASPAKSVSAFDKVNLLRINFLFLLLGLKQIYPQRVFSPFCAETSFCPCQCSSFSPSGEASTTPFIL